MARIDFFTLPAPVHVIYFVSTECGSVSFVHSLYDIRGLYDAFMDFCCYFVICLLKCTEKYIFQLFALYEKISILRNKQVFGIKL